MKSGKGVTSKLYLITINLENKNIGILLIYILMTILNHYLPSPAMISLLVGTTGPELF